MSYEMTPRESHSAVSALAVFGAMLKPAVSGAETRSWTNIAIDWAPCYGTEYSWRTPGPRRQVLARWALAWECTGPWPWELLNWWVALSLVCFLLLIQFLKLIKVKSPVISLDIIPTGDCLPVKSGEYARSSLTSSRCWRTKCTHLEFH